MSCGQYVPEVTALADQIRPMIGKMPIKFPRWISTPDGDLGSEWCTDCGYYKVRNLRHRDRKRQRDYTLDGGYRSEEEHFCHCVACGVRLDVCLTDYGVEEAIRTFEECGFSTAEDCDAYELVELLERVEYASSSGDNPEQRSAVVAIAQAFLAQASTTNPSGTSSPRNEIGEEG